VELSSFGTKLEVSITKFAKALGIGISARANAKPNLWKQEFLRRFETLGSLRLKLIEREKSIESSMRSVRDYRNEP
jgi:hypothetical protein